MAGLVGCGSSEQGGETGEELNFGTGPALADLIASGDASYEVLFTNPVCKDYKYPQPVRSLSGELLTQKPKNTFCSKSDSKASGSREDAPQYRLIEWINDAETKEVFFTYLSYSNSAVTKALCSAIQDRGVKVTFVIDESSDTTKADELMACGAERFEKRGHEGGIGYAHNKLFVINPKTTGDLKFAFSSGNMSSGVVLHHENWNFITVPASTYLAQAHLCMIEGELEHHSSKSEYKAFIKECRSNIEAEQERDIRVFFAPAEGKAAGDMLVRGVEKADRIDIGAHRFSFNRMINALKWRMNSSDRPEVRIVSDDDIHWAGEGEVVGDNNASEYWNIKNLTKLGAKNKYMETNHAEHLLHHNKFLIFDMPSGEADAVFGGAGNLTGTAFGENWENFYYITIPSVVDAFKTQYEHFWNDLATAPEDLPESNILPPTE